MCFGALPLWTQPLADMLPVQCWPQTIRCRQPLFNQMIVNSYQPGEGITSHVDLLKFDDGIAIISLGAPATMTFTKTPTDVVAGNSSTAISFTGHKLHEAAHQTKYGVASTDTPDEGDTSGSKSLHDIYLESGDVLLLHGEARYVWEHGIAAQQHCSMQCSANRVSVTLRKMAAV